MRRASPVPVVRGRALATGPSRQSVDIALLLVILLYGIGPPALKAISGPALIVGLARTVLAAPLMTGVSVATGGRIDGRVLRAAIVPGLMWAVNTTSGFAALGHTSVAVFTVLQALQPGVVLIGARVLLGEAVTRRGVLWTVVGVLGAGVVVLGGDAKLRGDALGVVLSAASLLSYSVFYLINRRIRATGEVRALEFLGGATWVSVAVLAPIALIGDGWSRVAELDGRDWALLVVVALLVNTTAHGVMSWLHAHITVARTSVVFLGCNVVAILISWPVHDEPVTLAQLAGCAVTFVAVAAILRGPTPPPPIDGLHA